MIVQLIIILIAFFFNIYFNEEVKNNPSSLKRNKKNYIKIMCFFLILQSGLRHVAVGADTYAYYLTFLRHVNQEWYEVFTKFNSVYIEGEGKDAGYGVIMKIFLWFSSNYQLYLLAIATFFFAGFGKISNRLCQTINDFFLCILVYQVLFYNFYSITGLRQTIATGILFFAFPYILKRKLLKFLILSVIAATIHKSALIFIPFYFIAFYKKPIKYLTLVLISLPILFVFVQNFGQYLTSFSISENYAGYTNEMENTGGAKSFISFMCLFALLIILCGKELPHNSTSAKICINAFSIGLLFTPLIWMNSGLMRVVMYFSIFSAFFMGEMTRFFSKKYNFSYTLINTIIIIVLSGFIISRNAQYAFFWEEKELGGNYKERLLH